MNDSFLEDLALVPTDTKNVNTHAIDRHITTRPITSTPLHPLQSTKGDNLNHKIEQATYVEKQSILKEYTAKETKKLAEHDTRKQQMKVKFSEKRERTTSDSKLKPIENKVKSDDHEIKEDVRSRTRETRLRVSDSKVTLKDRSRRSGSCKENNQVLDAYVKENSRPPDSSKEDTSHVEVPKEKIKTHEPVKKLDIKESDYTALLSAIKDIVCTQTKQESSKIFRAMQELHFNAQANLVKQLMIQTDELTNEMRPNKDSSKMRSLIEQNEKLKEDVIVLQKQNEELQKKVEELEFLKQENLTLKLKCKEILK